MWWSTFPGFEPVCSRCGTAYVQDPAPRPTFGPGPGDYDFDDAGPDIVPGCACQDGQCVAKVAA